MGTGPEEWVMVTRSRGRFWGALIIALGMAIVGAAALVGLALNAAFSYHQLMWLVGAWIAALVLSLWAAAAALEDLQRLVWRRLAEE